MPFLPSAARNARPFYPGTMGEEGIARKRDGLVPVGEVIADLPGPVQAIRDASPQAVHHFTQADQVNQLAKASAATGRAP